MYIVPFVNVKNLEREKKPSTAKAKERKIYKKAFLGIKSVKVAGAGNLYILILL